MTALTERDAKLTHNARYVHSCLWSAAQSERVSRRGAGSSRNPRLALRLPWALCRSPRGRSACRRSRPSVGLLRCGCGGGRLNRLLLPHTLLRTPERHHRQQVAVAQLLGPLLQSLPPLLSVAELFGNLELRLACELLLSLQSLDLGQDVLLFPSRDCAEGRTAVATGSRAIPYVREGRRFGIGRRLPTGRSKGLGGGRLTFTVGAVAGARGGGLFGGGSGGGAGIVDEGHARLG